MAAIKEEREVEEYKRKGRRSSQVRGWVFLVKKVVLRGKDEKTPQVNHFWYINFFFYLLHPRISGVTLNCSVLLTVLRGGVLSVMGKFCLSSFLFLQNWINICFWLKQGVITKKFMHPQSISRNLITSYLQSPVFSGHEDRFLFSFLPFFFSFFFK